MVIHFSGHFHTLKGSRNVTSVNIENLKTRMSYKQYFGGVCLFDEASG
jgi:hypothetical protein